MKESNETDMVFLDNATNKISANIAGYDGCIHREVLQRALSKNYNDLKAFELLQLGKSIWEDVNEENLIRAVETLNKCITLNPENATAHAVLADVYYAFVRNNFPLTDASMKSAENIKKAIKLDPKNSIENTSAQCLYRYRGSFNSGIAPPRAEGCRIFQGVEKHHKTYGFWLFLEK